MVLEVELSDSVLGVSGTETSDQSSEHPQQHSNQRARTWAFTRRPFWLFSHVFVTAALVLFVAAAFWQLGRWNDRKDANEIIRTRADAPVLTIAEALERPTEELNYVRVADSGHFTEANLIRVANRSFDGQAGDWMLGLFETDDGQMILVNRGFVPREAATRGEPAASVIQGWLRLSQEKETFGATDNGVSERVPRLDVKAISDRIGTPVVPVWLQQDEPRQEKASTYPLAIPLPELNNGSHFSYAVQWAIFSALTAGAYVLILRKKSLEGSGSD